MAASQGEWTPSSWRTKPMTQYIAYPSMASLSSALSTLSNLPPIVHPSETRSLLRSLASVSRGEAFLLQGGDCAETFDYCNSTSITSKIHLLLQMSLVLIWGAQKPVVRIGRLAGQFAKPRSSPIETQNGISLPSYRGDNINGFAFTPEARAPDPQRLVQAYFHSAATMNHIRAELGAGIADLHTPKAWDLGHVRDESLKAEYGRITESISESLRFMQTVGADRSERLRSVELFTSHEALSLPYEEVLTRPAVLDSSSAKQDFFNTSAHFLWIGDRTRQPDGAHVEYARGIANPIGVKIGPTTTANDLRTLLDTLNPACTPGRLVLITRYGAGNIADCLPRHLTAVRATKHADSVIWQCDPMHGNTVSAPGSGVKTRRFEDVVAELREAFRIHRVFRSRLGGVHLELTGDAVTECVGGAEGVDEEDLIGEGYQTFCDPRLNQKQALEVAFLIAAELRKAAEG
ncbi:MAG: hypothetical protein M1814_005813 [Vezdaea aestivalis]|nr:MAG: hypothetical protein M1814_005813 [Vezdaea aestivalis]